LQSAAKLALDASNMTHPTLTSIIKDLTKNIVLGEGGLSEEDLEDLLDNYVDEGQLTQKMAREYLKSSRAAFEKARTIQRD
jgi:hypothetical protein